MNKILKRGIALFLAIVLAVPFINGTQAFAATKKPSLSKTKMTIGVGGTTTAKLQKYGDGSSWYGTWTDNVITVKNSQKGATYTFTSSNKKVATVKGSKTKGTITGVKAGTATITVKQKYKGKTTTVGKCKVTVKQATKVSVSPEGKELYIGNQLDLGGGWTMSDIFYIPYKNPKATYTFTTDKEGLTISIQKNAYTSDIQTYTATKAGTYTVTVKETYKKKTRTIGKMSFKVLPVTVEKTGTMYIDAQEAYQWTEDAYYANFNTRQLLKNGAYIPYIVEVANDEFKGSITLTDKEVNDGYEVYSYVDMDSTKEGSVELNYYYKNADGSKGELLGSSTVEIKQGVKDIVLEKDTSLTLATDDWDLVKLKGYFGDGINTSAYVPKIIATSSDAALVTVEYSGGYLELMTKDKTGEATVTLSCGSVKKEIKVKVVKEE